MSKVYMTRETAETFLHAFIGVSIAHGRIDNEVASQCYMALHTLTRGSIKVDPVCLARGHSDFAARERGRFNAAVVEKKVTETAEQRAARLAKRHERDRRRETIHAIQS